jgi:hypothetical protein
MRGKRYVEVLDQLCKKRPCTVVFVDESVGVQAFFLKSSVPV